MTSSTYAVTAWRCASSLMISLLVLTLGSCVGAFVLGVPRDTVRISGTVQSVVVSCHPADAPLRSFSLNEQELGEFRRIFPEEFEYPRGGCFNDSVRSGWFTIRYEDGSGLDLMFSYNRAFLCMDNMALSSLPAPGGLYELMTDAIADRGIELTNSFGVTEAPPRLATP